MTAQQEYYAYLNNNHINKRVFNYVHELEDYDNMILNLKNKTGENAGKIVMESVKRYKEEI